MATIWNIVLPSLWVACGWAAWGLKVRPKMRGFDYVRFLVCLIGGPVTLLLVASAS